MSTPSPFRTAYDPPAAGRWPWSGMGSVTLDGRVMGVFGVHLDLGPVPPELREHVIRAATGMIVALSTAKEVAPPLHEERRPRRVWRFCRIMRVAFSELISPTPWRS